MSDDDLKPSEVAEVTGKTAPAAQAKRLIAMGVPFTFLGRAVRVSRAAAVAHEIMPKSAARAFDTSSVR